MATIAVTGDEVAVRLSRWAVLGSIHWSGSVTAPRSAVVGVEFVDDAWTRLRGIRAPGTGLPGVIMLGTTRAHGQKDFCAVYGHRPGVVVTFDPARSEFARWVLTGDPAVVAPGLGG